MVKSRKFWMFTAVAILVGATWVMVTQRNSASNTTTPQETKTNQALRPKAEDRYAPANFDSASLSENRLTLTGTGSPKSAVTLYLAEQPLTSEKPDESGFWGTQIDLPARYNRPPAMMFESITKLPDGTDVKSDEILVLITEPDNGVTPGKDAILVVTPGGASRILGLPFGREPEDDGLILHGAEYDNAGGVIFSGRSDVDARILLRANSVPLGETGMTEDGEWTLIAGLTLPVGKYTISIQRLDADGKITANMELPFERRNMTTIPDGPDDPKRSDNNGDITEGGFESPKTLEPVLPAKINVDFQTDYWTISRALYGGGWQHTILYAPIALIP